jgi:TonB family protein
MTSIAHHLYERYFSIALGLSILLHLSMIGTYYLACAVSGDDDRIVHVILYPHPNLPIPPSIINTDPGNTFTPIIARTTTGIPVPVPDADVHPETEYVTPGEFNNGHATPVNDPGPGTEGVYTPPAVIQDPEETIFTIVEKNPVPVIQVAPEYPEIARRTGLEGKTTVKLLVNKEGKVKKATILASDSDIFNEPSITAALQWVFTPGMMNNGPVSVWVCIPFHFRLAK